MRQNDMRASRGTIDVRRDTAAALTRWILSGGTQDGSGAYCGWRDLATGRLSPPYPEITGYVLGFLARSVPGGAQSPQAASASAWLAERVMTGDLSARPEASGPAVFTFDVAMAAHGLISHGLAAGDESAVAAGLRAARLLVDEVERHGTLLPVVPETISTPLPPTWSTMGRAHLLKCVQALLTAAGAGLAAARRLADKLVRDALSHGEATVPELINGCRGGEGLSLHAVCYAAEGLWLWGSYQDDATALARSRELTEWVWRHQLVDGGLPGFVSGDGYAVEPQRQSDVLAQALRLHFLHRLPESGSAEALESLLESVWRDGSRAAVIYRPGSSDAHLNAWAAMFAAQALLLSSGDLDTLEWSQLV